MTKIGLIARGEDRGLGILTWEFSRHMRPDRVLLVHMGELARGFATHADRFPGATVVSFDGVELPEASVREWLDGLDVVYSAETFYDRRFVSWAAAAGVKTVLHVMPEFYRADLDPPDEIWLPTPWRADLVPHTRVVPVPVARERFADSRRDFMPAGPLRVLHVAGHRAINDRNGTNLVMAAAARTAGVDITISTQDRMRIPFRRGLTLRAENVPDYWRAYDGFDALVMPRRFGGLCLPAQEAAAAGLALIMTDCSPNSGWPIVAIKVTGDVHMSTATAADVARSIMALADNRERLEHMQEQARAWAADISWEVQAGAYRRFLCE